MVIKDVCLWRFFVYVNNSLSAYILTTYINWKMHTLILYSRTCYRPITLCIITLIGFIQILTVTIKDGMYGYMHRVIFMEHSSALWITYATAL